MKLSYSVLSFDHTDYPRTIYLVDAPFVSSYQGAAEQNRCNQTNQRSQSSLFENTGRLKIYQLNTDSSASVHLDCLLVNGISFNAMGFYTPCISETSECFRQVYFSCCFKSLSLIMIYNFLECTNRLRNCLKCFILEVLCIPLSVSLSPRSSAQCFLTYIVVSLFSCRDQCLIQCLRQFSI